MALDLMNLFKNIKWAENGDITDMSQTNYEVGWAHLGDDTPTVEDFNLIQQLNDRKDQWLFAQVESVLKAKSINPTEVDLNALVRAVKLIAAGYSTPLAISSMSTNNSTELGHTHQIAKASLTQQGIVQLNSATNSDNETMAATPKAVKTAYDLANSKQSPATTLAGYGIGNFKVEPFVGNLNTLKTDGVYAITQASLSQNLPVSTSCHIKVIAGGDGAWCRQLAYVAYSTDVYERHQTSYQTDSWSPWVKIDSLDKIPNSKKSSAVNSDSADTVATSVAVKTAYDKGVEAKNAADGAQRTANEGVSKATTAQTTANSAVTKADNAQRAADNANNNANGRVLKSGDTMIGMLKITGSSTTYQVNGYGWPKKIELSGDSVIGNEACVIGFNNNGTLHLGGKPNSSEFNASINETGLWVKGDVVTKIGASLNNAFMKTGGVVTGDTSFKQGDWSGISFFNNSGRYTRIESNPHSNNSMLSFIYRESNGSNINVASLPRKDGTILLDSDISHAINGTNKAKVASEFALGELNKTKANLADFSYQKIGNFEIRKYPDGTMMQSCRVLFTPNNRNTITKTLNWALSFVGENLRINATPIYLPQDELKVKAAEAGMIDVANANVAIVQHSNNKFTIIAYDGDEHSEQFYVDVTAIGRWR